MRQTLKAKVEGTKRIRGMRKSEQAARETIMKSSAAKHSGFVAGHYTSVYLKDEFWNGLREIAKRRHESLSHLLATINADRHSGNLSTTIRQFVLRNRQHRRPSAS
jgi:predicted DNA-binding ribbon-helix-helix protein